MTRILIADDNAQNLYLLESILKGYRFEVLSARNGAEALDLALKNPPDMIVTDILMPVMDGFELCRRWKADGRLNTIPFVFYTATYTDIKDEKFALSLGADRFVVKPQMPEIIAGIVHELLDEYGKNGHAVPGKPLGDEMEILRQYNGVLFRKLERKVLQFEAEIAERKRVEEELREYAKRLKEAQEMAHLGFWTWDVKTGQVEWSDEVYRIFGLDPKEFTPQIGSILALSPWPEEQQRGKELIHRAMESREPGTYEQRFLKPDKSTGYYYSTFQGRYDGEGDLVSIVGTVLDITARKEAEEKIRLANHKLALMTEVTYQDIQNKVTALRGYADLSRTAANEDERLGFIVRETEILESIHDLIRKTKDYQQMGVDKSCWIPIEPTIRMQFSLMSIRHNVALDCDLHGLEICADPLIDRVFYNLIHNAIQHGRTTTRISFYCKKMPGGVMLVCEDNGGGIVPEEKTHIFGRIVGGGGKFGLFFTKEFLTLSGITIRETGEPGKGARFEIMVPEELCRFG